MREPKELVDARRCLAQAEAGLRTADGLARLAEGLALLEDVLAAGSPAEAATAANLASTYAGRLYGRIDALVRTDQQLPEPELEHFFKVVLAFDSVSAALPASAADLKVAVVKRLIDRYYEGHPPENKARILRELAQLAGRD